MRITSRLNYKKAPKRRWTDRIRALADDLWELGRKKESEDMHDYARKKERERRS